MNVAVTHRDVIAPVFFRYYNDALRNGHREYWTQGGRGSMKSTTISVCILANMCNDAVKWRQGIYQKSDLRHAVVYRKVGSDLRGSVVEQFLWSIDKLNLSRWFTYNGSSMTLTLNPTGQTIRFRGLDKAVKSKSIKCRFGYFGMLWFEELEQFNGMEEIRNVKQSVLRGGEHCQTFYSYNPPMHTSNWVNVEAGNVVQGRLVHKSNYMQVPRDWNGEEFWLEAAELKKNNELAYRHEYLGEATGTGNNVFGNIHVRKITAEERARFDNLHYGLDWGYTNAFTWVACHHDVKRKRLYIFDEIYGKHLTTTLAAEKVLEKDMHYLPIYADSEDANSIAQFNNDYGILTLPVVKGPDSRRFGFRWLQDLHEIVIDPETCPNAKREFESYEYEKDKNGNIIEEYPKENDHILDAVRYAMENESMLKRGMF